MRKFNNKSGFTLIEIIVVLIIIGILAAIALPNLFSNVTKSRGSAAIAAMDGVKTGVEAWAAQNPGSVPATAQVTALGLPGAPTATAFGYGIATAAQAQNGTNGVAVQAAGTSEAGSLNYSIVATDTTGNTIALTRATNGTFSCSAPTGGPYAGAC